MLPAARPASFLPRRRLRFCPHAAPPAGNGISGVAFLISCTPMTRELPADHSPHRQVDGCSKQEPAAAAGSNRPADDVAGASGSSACADLGAATDDWLRLGLATPTVCTNSAAPARVQWPFPPAPRYPLLAGGLSDNIRVISPPAQGIGIWFALQAAQRQGREPFLPQIPRSYLRIKDGRVSVRLVIKYLVTKLGLQDESEVEMRCRGRELLPFLTLQHIRDNIWSQRPDVVVTPDWPAANHVMVLQYGRRP